MSGKRERSEPPCHPCQGHRRPADPRQIVEPDQGQQNRLAHPRRDRGVRAESCWPLRFRGGHTAPLWQQTSDTAQQAPRVCHLDKQVLISF